MYESLLIPPFISRSGFDQFVFADISSLGALDEAIFWNFCLSVSPSSYASERCISFPLFEPGPSSDDYSPLPPPLMGQSHPSLSVRMKRKGSAFAPPPPCASSRGGMPPFSSLQLPFFFPIILGFFSSRLCQFSAGRSHCTAVPTFPPAQVFPSSTCK